MKKYEIFGERISPFRWNLEILKRTPLIFASIPFATFFPVQTERPLGNFDNDMYDIITLPHLNSLGQILVSMDDFIYQS